MARIRVELDHDGMEDMLCSDPVADAVGNAAEDVAVRAQSFMSVHYTGPLTYAVEEKILDGSGSKYGSRRAAAAVSTEHMLGPALERKYGPLRKAISSGG